MNHFHSNWIGLKLFGSQDALGILVNLIQCDNSLWALLQTCSLRKMKTLLSSELEDCPIAVWVCIHI